jgi:hypothetical protein
VKPSLELHIRQFLQGPAVSFHESADMPSDTPRFWLGSVTALSDNATSHQSKHLNSGGSTDFCISKPLILNGGMSRLSPQTWNTPRRLKADNYAGSIAKCDKVRLQRKPDAEKFHCHDDDDDDDNDNDNDALFHGVHIQEKRESFS